MSISEPGAKFRAGTVTVGDYVLDYAEAGPTEPAATIVSFPGSAGLEMSTAKDTLADTYRIIEINPPGWGGKEDLTHPMGMDEFAAVLVEAADQLVDGPYFLLGTSMGGANAIHAAVMKSDRVKGVVLEASMAPVAREDLYFPDPPAIDPSMGIENYPLPPVHPRKPWATEDFMRTQMLNRMKMFPFTRLDMLPAALADLAAQGTPVLALLGESDEIIKPSQRDRYDEYLPDAQYVSIASAGHDIQNTSPEEFVDAVKAFVNLHSGA
ncbi:alpha/beta fold hydrolase [Agromyces sp. SYSU T00266]|uniref:alpha/beta fold hydrolase n=1 Tax=Agromyces zhanjiangensis TaxID=3158562 RepID=UPI003395F2A4